MTDIKDKIIADLRSELDTARAVIKLMEEQQQRDEERHEHELREAKRHQMLAMVAMREKAHDLLSVGYGKVWRQRVLDLIDGVSHE